MHFGRSRDILFLKKFHFSSLMGIPIAITPMQSQNALQKKLNAISSIACNTLN